jgi:hypothetical protein
VPNKTFIFVEIGFRSMDTSNSSFTAIISTSIMIITVNGSGNTSNFFFTRIFITLIVIPTSVRIIGDYTPFIFIAVSFMTFIRGNTFFGNIGVNTTGRRTTRIFGTFVIIIANDRGIFTRFSITIGITIVISTFIPIITINGIIYASRIFVTSYRVASVFFFANINFIDTST